MADKAKSSVKSGCDAIAGDYLRIQGGLPPKKGVDQIDKENTPKKAPNSSGR